ncbi:fumarylacetoacetate hydrolase family protein [Granulicella sp. dw_53]|uniref:fumarylacetoacetate hydrolase family protein n=1 Tax=Granulicella sp. dw_53 TaxID=2719792 RepID=UPI001BD20858|nr:fumarylacetoacetate hydrolase family protein [Granulicella sp. dw_53]
MKLVTFSTRAEAAGTQSKDPATSVASATLGIDNPTPGVLLDNEVADLSSLGYPTLLKLIEAGKPALEEVAAKLPKASRIPLSAVTLHAPIPRPPRVFAIGLNYHKHAVESNLPVQKVPTVFLKLSSSVIGPDVSIILPKISTEPDYEAEFAFVIGKPGYQIPLEFAMDYVLGYTIVNDVSARDIQLSTSQWNLGKSFPTFTPIGPSITTADEVSDPHNLRISLTINGETLQDSNTSDLIFKIPALIAYISSITPLEAGDIVSTGTPEGVGLGRTPKRWLKPNEEIVITIEKLGSLRNSTIAEP